MIKKRHDLNLIWGSLLWDIVPLMTAAGISPDEDTIRDRFGIPEEVLAVVMHDQCKPETELLSFIDEKYLINEGHAELSNLKSPIAGRGFYDIQEDLFNDQLVYPESERKDIPRRVIKDILDDIASASSKVPVLTERILIDVLEQKASYISLNGGRSSVFENAKLRTGIACCLNMAGGRGSILICSFDFLGIKDFKFRKEFSSAPATLCASSLYVDIMRENFLDDYYLFTGLSYANTIFSGGRHLHLFIPDTERIRGKTEQFVRSFNSWLVSNYGIQMYVSYGMSEVGNPDMKCNDGAEHGNPFKRYYSDIASQRNIMETSKYSARDIIELKHTYSAEGASDTNRRTKLIVDMILRNYNKDSMIKIYDHATNQSVEIGPRRFMSFAKNTGKAPLRCYWRKNDNFPFDLRSGLNISDKEGEFCGIWYGGLPDFEQGRESGIFENHSCAILRLDIDNFREGLFGSSTGVIYNPDFAGKMEQSKHLGLFLRRDIYILADSFVKSNNSDEPYKKLLWIIHEGADDAFITGEYSAVLKFSDLLIRHYYRYSKNNMSFSGGICRYDPQKMSFGACAAFAQLLMDHAKETEGKNSVVIEDDEHCIKWERIADNV